MTTAARSLTVFDYALWEAKLDTLNRFFQNAHPFPHIVLENFLDDTAAREVMEQFPNPEDPKWTHYTHVNERKMAQTKKDLLPPAARAVIDELNGPRFLRFLENLSGLTGLLPDESLQGGGLHQSKKGGFLNMHADFTSHPHRPSWARRLNVLVYFNEHWQDGYQGLLQLWDKDMKQCVKKVAPAFNRCLIFRTDKESYHGFPEPLQCPEAMTRKSMALYYFTEEKNPFTRSTEYRSTPQDSLSRKGLIFLDKMALRGFFFFKRRLGLSDDTAGKILKVFSRA